jgi:hypothetical protein
MPPGYCVALRKYPEANSELMLLWLFLRRKNAFRDERLSLRDVIGPNVGARVEELNNLACDVVQARNIWTLLQIAMWATPAKIHRVVVPAVLFCSSDTFCTFQRGRASYDHSRAFARRPANHPQQLRRMLRRCFPTLLL